MDKRTRAKFTTLAKRVNEASGTAADLATAKTDIENLKTSKANIEDLTAAAGRIDVLEAESASVKQLVAGNASVADLTAATGRIDDLEADTVSLEQAVVEKASIADLNATNVEISNLKTDKANITDLNAANAEIDTLKTGKASVADLTAATGRIDDLEAENASVKELVASKADVKDLTAATGRIDSLETGKADVDLLNVAKATIESLLVRGGIITDSLSGVEINATKFLTGVTIIGDVIKAGTLAADRIILTGENGLIYELNVNAGNLTASQLTQEQYKQALDGSVLVASSITTDKLAAGSVTAQVIASRAVKADHIESGAITTDKLAAKAVKAEKIDVDNLFAQDITASGTITGAKLNGVEVNGQQFHLRSQSSPPEGFSPSFVEIDAGAESSYQRIRLGSGYVQDGTDVSAGYIYLDSDGKIQMGGITIHFNGMSFFPNGIYGDLTGTASKATKADSADNASKLSGLSAGNRWGNIPKIGADGVMEVGKYLDFHSSDNADKKDYDVRVTCEGDSLTIPKLASDKITDNSYSTNTYTSFSGSVVSSGSVVVTKKLGMCFISGTVTLSGNIGSWTTILPSSKVPAPQHGELVPFDASQWGTSYARTLRGRIPAGGGLQLVYGAAGSYVINISYPIE